MIKALKIIGAIVIILAVLGGPEIYWSMNYTPEEAEDLHDRFQFVLLIAGFVIAGGFVSLFGDKK